MKKLLLILLCVPLLTLAQQTYVPDDVFEEYIETYFSAADNGIINDNYVLTAGLNLPGNFGIWLTPGFLNGQISDLTGIQDVKGQFINIDNQLITVADLSQVNFKTPLAGMISGIIISNCPILETVYLPGDSIGGLSIFSNTYLENIYFHDSSYFEGNGQGLVNISNNPNITSIDLSNILGLEPLDLAVGSNNNLTQLNLQNGFCYNWSGATFGQNPNLFCIQVDDPNYSQISPNWGWGENILYPTTYQYSSNCLWSSLSEFYLNRSLIRITDILGRETEEKQNTLLFYIYNDGKVEKKIIIE